MAKDSEKIVLDPIHGMIHLEPLAVKIIDTPDFQRLRHIKQLSFADFVYPGATHTRFAHSIGVYHLARQMIKVIKGQKLPEGATEMTKDDETCIRVAALCHDLGHGPFSHAYEEMAEKVLDSKLKHEDISVFLVERIFNDSDDLKNELGSDPEESIKLIKALIQGKSEENMTDDEKKKKYMFQIVSNKDTGVDVDKWDYFHRDAKACGLTDRFHYDRALSVARVVKVKGKDVFELGYRDYDAFHFYNMFNTRFTLHRKVYKHKVVTAMSLMVKDVFTRVHAANTNPDPNKKIDEKFKIDVFPIIYTQDSQGSSAYMQLNDGKYLHMDKYLQLRDDVLLKVHDSSEYEEARDVIQRINKRQLYKLVDCDIPIKRRRSEDEKANATQIKRRRNEDEKAIATQIIGKIKDRLKEVEDWKADDVDVMEVKINYGQGNDDPVEKLNFYSKRKYEGEPLKRDKVSSVLPSVFQDYHVRVYEKISSIGGDEEKKKKKLENIVKIVKDVKKEFENESTSEEDAMSACTSYYRK